MYNDVIFREYDIRGVVNKDFDIKFANVLGGAYASLLFARYPKPTSRTRYRIALGRDVRPSGEFLWNEFCSALTDAGIDVIDLGQCPTPLAYFSLHHYDVDGAVIITGSHNPSEYNGFKMCVGKDSLHGESIQDLKRLCKNPEPRQGSSKGSVSKDTHVIPDYIEFVASSFQLKRKTKVVIDAGNACGALVAPKLLKKLGLDVIELFCDVDGTFPNHHPDPTVPENLKDLQDAVLKHKADLGIAFDGDADRIGVVDEKGTILYGDELMVLYSREILSRKPGAKIIGEVKCSQRLYDDIKAHGGIPLMWKTGHSLIKSKLKIENAALAGEMSGHMFFADRYFGYDDALYAAVRLLEILDHNPKNPLSTLLADLPKAFNTPEIRVDCPDELKFDIVRSVKENIERNYPQYKMVDIDGLRIEATWGWGLLRASNTQPVVVMRFEGQTQEQLKKLQDLVTSEFSKALQLKMN